MRTLLNAYPILYTLGDVVIGTSILGMLFAVLVIGSVAMPDAPVKHHVSRHL